MASVLSTPVSTWTAGLMNTLTGVNQSSSLTATVHLTAGWEIQVPIIFSGVGSISANPVVNIFASMDGGTTFDSAPFLSFSITPVTNGGGVQSSIRLTTGQYCVQLLNSGPNSAVFAIKTQMVVTAVVNT